MTTSTAFTKGPWKVRGNQGSYCEPEIGCENEIVDGDENLVLAAVISDCIPEANDNAHLIAAAPDLYEALKGLLAFAEEAETKMLVGDEGCLWTVEIARVALAKAEGGSNGR